MPTSSATLTPTRMELTPMRVTFDGTDLGGTLSNVVLTLTYEKAEIHADQLGTTVIDRRVSGQKYTIETELTEIYNKDIWKVVFPHAKEVTSGGNKQIYFESQIGDGDLSNAKQLKLHPLSLSNGDLSGDYTIYKACASADSSITYGPGEQSRLKIIWNVLPDTSTVPAKFLTFGDPAIGLIAASFTGPTYVGTGNGTMTGTAVYSGFTITETITATVVTAAANGGVFHVSGSVSGSLGLATVGIAFSNSKISFLINDGSTDFVVGDQFTIPTTAANYA